MASDGTSTTFNFILGGQGDGLVFMTSTGDAITAYAWDFGDGTTSTEANPTHTYSAAGPYDVRLTVTDDDGASTGVSHPVSVSARRQEAGGGPGVLRRRTRLPPARQYARGICAYRIWKKCR